ncbi:hypothetical protein WICMUC_003507 [Wickerhamomyces mucosus]|uniref:SANT domain-containing protein n=1 Tax=Wickerhamomyces mucosus TaxID=1378264 RepID=A0A9P8PKI5_9ASCO|nr:hypothetical protein WICMUC_003507 [Wickerhamomyces mucosus]
MSADGNQRPVSYGRSYSSNGSYYGNVSSDGQNSTNTKNNNQPSNVYSRNSRYQQDNWTNQYGSYKRHERPKTSSSFSSNNVNNPNTNPINSGRPSRSFNSTYTNGSSYVPGRKWSGSSYQPTNRSADAASSYQYKGSYRGKGGQYQQRAIRNNYGSGNRHDYSYQRPFSNQLDNSIINYDYNVSHSSKVSYSAGSSRDKSDLFAHKLADSEKVGFNKSNDNDNETSNDFNESNNNETKKYNDGELAASIESKNARRGLSETITRPSLIPKDFKDDYDEDEDDELISALGNVQKKVETKESKESNLEARKNEALVNRLPLTLEHKEQLDEESTENSRESTETPLILKHEESFIGGIKHQEITFKDDASDVEMLDESSTKSEETKAQKADGTEKTVENIFPSHQEQTGGEDETKVQEVKQKIVEEKEEEEKEEEEEVVEEEKEEEEVEEEEESDSYDPEADHEVIKEEIKKSLKEEDIAAQNIKPEKPKQVKKIVPLFKVDSCIFPLPRVEDKVWQLKNHSRRQILDSLPHLLRTPIKNISEYTFVDKNFLVHEQGIKPHLLRNLSIIKGETFSKKASLLKEYQQRGVDWNERCNLMENQLQSLYPKKLNDTGIDNKLHEEVSIQPQDELNSRKTQSTRRSRHGDTVRSEAEFLEILKDLEREKEQDPLYKAEQVAAIVPDMILNPLERNLKVENVNNLVRNKQEWASRIKTDGIDNFSRKDHEAFCEAFLQYPKRFGKISFLMGGLRTPEECVLHYYKTKKTTDYKQMLLMKKKKARKGTKGKRGPKSKGSATTSAPDTPASVALDNPVESENEPELNLEDFIRKEPESGEIFNESGRPRRAAAPVFEFQEKDGAVLPEVIERKRLLENNGNNETMSDSNDSKKAKKRPRAYNKQKSKVAEETIATITASDNNLAAPTSDTNGNDISIESESSLVDAKISKSHITSYWSVKDTNLFTQLLSQYGTNWSVLAEKLKTKSPIMVRNYYQRNADALQLQSIAVASTEDTASGEPDISKNPPLGVFTANSSVPSNVVFQQRQPPQQHYFKDQLIESHRLPPTFGSIQQPQLESSAPQTSPKMSSIKQESVILPSAKSITSSISQPPVFADAYTSQSQQTPSPLATTSKSNPFSITSLLNPSDERSSVISKPPTLPKLNKKFVESELIQAKNDLSATSEMKPSTLHQIQPHLPSIFNPLDTLAAAVENKDSSILPNHSIFEAKNSVGGYYNGELSNYSSGYQQPYSESAERGRSLLNGSSETSSLLPVPASLKPISNRSSLGNLLHSDNKDQGQF